VSVSSRVARRAVGKAQNARKTMRTTRKTALMEGLRVAESFDSEDGQGNRCEPVTALGVTRDDL
jgi:hypothetical protein